MFERYDLLIHLCLHLDKHFNGSHMQLYSRADIAHLLAQWGTEIDATELRQRCATYNAEKEVMKVPGMVQSVFGAKLPNELQLLPGEETTLAALQQLEKHLDDRVSHESATQTHLFYLRKINSTTVKLNYLREVLLPGKRVMVRVYHLKKDRWYRISISYCSTAT